MAVRSAKKTSGIFTGVAAIDKKLAQFETKIQTKIARDELKKVTKKVIIAAQHNLQAAGHVKEGDLLRMIKDGAMKRSRSSIGRWVGTVTKTEDDFGGAQIELGRKNTNADSFLRKALRGNASYIQAEVIAGIERHINSIAVPNP